MRILSGQKPTGRPHIGNYFGAQRQWIDLQSQGEAFYFIADHHALNQVRDAEDLGEAVITLLAPDKAASLAQAGWSVTTESAHVVERIVEVMEARVYEREDAV